MSQKQAIREYDVVVLKSAVASVPVPPGTRGTVVIDHHSHPRAFEVEFVSEAGRSLGVFSIYEDDLDIWPAS